MIKIGVVLGSIRSQLGESIIKYLESKFRDTQTVQFDWIRLENFPLEPYQHDETPLSNPITGLKASEHKWLDQLKADDGFVIMTPEYDHAIPGVLKNALDYVGPEVDHKPVQIISYSYYSDGGMLAAESFVEILQMLKMMVLPTPVLLWNVNDNFTEAGELRKGAQNSDHFEARLEEAFHEIIFYTQLFHNHPFN